MENQQYNRGSEWRKWDLHVHTPFSLVNNYGGGDDATWEKFISDLESLPKEFSVLGINDYLFIDGYKKVLEYKKQGRLVNIDTIFPVIEFRIKKFCGHRKFKRINFHVILSDDLESEIIEQQFLNQLHGKYTLTPGLDKIDWSGIVTPESLADFGQKIKATVPGDRIEEYDSDIQEGFNNINFDETEIVKSLELSTYLKDHFLTAIGKTEWGEFHWSDSSIAEKKTIINSVDFVFTASESIDAFNRAKQKLTEEKVNDLLLDCSDAHRFSNDTSSKDRIGNCFTWVKSDPTFEGLKQILYEPKERVKIQDDNPSFEYNKPHFTQIEIEDEVAILKQEQDQVYFLPQSLPINKNLVTIIGGRGTGKSMLVDYWANIFNKTKDDNKLYSLDSNFSAKYAKDNVPEPTTEIYKGDGTNPLDFIYIKQAELKEISGKIEPEVKKLLDLEDLHFSQELNTEIQNVLENISELKNWFEEEDEIGRQLNKRSYVESMRIENEGLLSSIKTKNNKEKLEKYTKNISALKDLENNIDNINELKNTLEQTQEALNQKIAEVNARLPKKDGYEELKNVDFKTQLDNISENKKTAESKKKTKESENKGIEDDFNKEGFTGDLTSLLKNAELYQSRIKWANTRLETIEKKESKLEEELKNRDNLSTKIKAEYENQKNKIDHAWGSILEKHEGSHKNLIEEILLKERRTSVEGKIVFNEKIFYDQILKNVDRRSYKNVDALKKRLKISDFESWVKFVNEELKNIIDGEESEKFGNIESIFFGLKNRAEYLNTLPKITSNGKILDRLSVGQRGTVYLRLKLATDAFSKPIIFDQPEDDLDNKFIVNELIGIFRELKKYRQIIIVTHNANLVVNADAEQVIIADNTDEKLTYVSGSLENKDIIDGVCEILEGGEEAFEKRKHKYHFT